MNIKDTLDQLSIPNRGADHRHGRQGWVQIDCPDCGKGTGKFHLGINMVTGRAACWRCGRKYTPDVIARSSRLSQREAARLVKGAALAKPDKQKRTGRLVLPRGRVPLLKSPAHCSYLRGRGYDPEELVNYWGLEAITIAPRMPWHIFIPVHQYGKTVSWIARTIGTRVDRRYTAASEEEESVPHRELLYGEDYARHAIIVVEGPADVWNIGPGAVATCGLGYTPAQVNLMSKYPIRGICFDSTPSAQKRAGELADELSAYPGTTHIIQLDAEDAGAASRDEIKELRRYVLE